MHGEEIDGIAGKARRDRGGDIDTEADTPEGKPGERFCVVDEAFPSECTAVRNSPLSKKVTVGASVKR
jgi:hypothetical protein